ncbi:uncharacterized protein LOC119170786 [Rhipicephalus microplus]|uniref:uncharacterized protein LOC119170786 n=1 Tax=Rhipicephalus microplus TaxID=6941 RepID=UPI003F6ABBB7
MAIQQKDMYGRQLDKVFGLVDMGPEQQSCATPEVANRLLCFVLRGLSTAYVITLGYFFTRCLRSELLRFMTMNVMKAVEDVGFRVTRIVTDNHQSNVALFKSLSEDGMLAHVVPHPLRQGDPVFLSFDPNHLIKNLRNNIVEREMMDGDNLIQGGLHLKELLSIQSQLLVKPVRFLTQSHVEPNNLEKMKVSRATQVFSPVVIATLEFLQENPQRHPDATEFQDCLPTITFMKMQSKWYDLHNIGAVKPRGQREEPFYLIDDDRLSWLEVDFITYIEEIQLSGGKTKKKMTKETCEATIMTTGSTVALIQHLLDNNFRYVLTRALNSDPVDSLFSCFRQFNGGNDRVDARTVVFTAEKLLKVGILQAAKSGNAPHSSETNAPLKLKAREGNTAAVPLVVVLGAKRLSYELEVLNVYLAVPDDLELAPLVYLAGYIARACEEKLPCESCKVLLQETKPCSSIYDLVKKIDNGQLRYPNMEIVKICKLACDFVSEVMKDTEVRRSGNLCKLLHSALLPHLVTCPALRCGSGSLQHTKQICDAFFFKSCFDHS